MYAFLSVAMTTLFCCLCVPATAADVPLSPPNVVILLADDLGFADVGYHGGKIETPNIDRLARQGVRLERFYACPVCSPTRAGLMTGRYPIRLGLMRAVIPPWRKYGMPTDEQTLADLLAKAGYERRAAIGKWHLGHSARKYHPLRRGFTHFYGHYNGAIDYFTHLREDALDWHRDFDLCDDKGYSTDLIGREAVRFVEESPVGKPFFLYVPFNAPHSPLQAKEVDLKKYARLQGRRKLHAAMVDSMDQAIGRILGAIDRRGIADDTLVLFFSDNGGVTGVADNGPLRGGKAGVYEGGVRVPAVIHWPRGIPGGRTVDARMGYIDVYPTLKRIVGLKDDADANPLDGRDMLDVICGRAKPADRDWYSYIAQSGPERIAVSTDGWKLIVQGPGVLESDAVGKSRVELFRIDRDPYEKTDLAEEHPEVVGEMLARLKTFRRLKIDGVPPYGEGREGFVPPKDWVIPE
ncbi:MAG: sulfatase-like hydrolase/transferase [Candidatus Nealsonbacteria bacterium]|nr:sulfatase-like hydrolase/transferase [Candidatus Nealsonbacteria bacterium]